MKENDYKQQLLDLIEGINNLKHFHPLLKLKGGLAITEGSLFDTAIGYERLDTIIRFEDGDILPIINTTSYRTGVSISDHIFEKNHWEQVYYNFLMYLLFAKDNRGNEENDYIDGKVITVIPIPTLLMEGYERTREVSN